MRLVSELERRNVIRMAVLYVVAAWLIMQVAGVLIDLGSLPASIGPIILPLLALGFPIALVFSWFYEFTPEGISLEKDVDPAESITYVTSKRMNFIVIALLCAAVILFSYDKWWIGAPPGDGSIEQGNRTTDQNSLAVLPFTNRSGLAENAYFVGGIHDDLLTMLAKIDSLSVTSRTSVMRYQGSALSIPEISRELRVRYILEGAVQRDGDQIRVNAQLIDADRDDHLWAETFDRELSTASLFAIQSNIARSITAALDAELSKADEHLLDNIPTASLAAYDAYLMGNQSLLGNSIEAYETALTYFDEALSQDASFAGAYAGACNTELGLFAKTSEISHFEAAESACEQALAIDEDSAEVHVALGTLFRRHGDYQRAETEQRMALVSEPRNVEAMIELGLVLANMGKIREAEAILLKAELLQPNHWPVQDYIYTFYRNFDDQPDRYERSVKHAMRVVELNPKNSAAWNNLGTAYHSLQQYDAAKAAWDSALQLEPTRTAYTNRGLQYFYEGHYADAAEMQLKAIKLAPNDHRVWGRLAESYRAMGADEDLQKDAYATAIPLAESRLEINDQDWRTRAMLATYYAYSEREDDAQQQIEAALGISKRNPEALLYAALLANALGNKEATLAILEEMVKANASYRDYAANEPDLRSLHGNERFERLINP